MWREYKRVWGLNFLNFWRDRGEKIKSRRV